MTNTATPIRLVRSLQGDTLSSIVWRHVGRSSGAVEAVLADNPHLAHLPPVLPADIPIKLVQTNTDTPAPTLVRLWD